MGINGRYVRIATKFWADEKVVDLDPETKLLYLYILSCPHSNMAGYYRLPKPYIQADLKLSEKGLTKGFDKLLSKGLIKYCEKSSVILIPNYYKYNSIQNKNQAIGAVNRTSELPRNSLVEDYVQAIKTYANNQKEELCKGLPKGFDKGLPKGSGNTEPELELDSDSDTDSEKDKVTFVRNFKKFQTKYFKKVLPPNERPKFNENSMPYKAAKYLRKRVLENNRRQPVPEENPKGLEDWAIELDRLNRLGPVGAKENEKKGYSWEEIGKIMEWCQDHHFWKDNIQSAGKFREKITQLENKMNSENKSKSKNKINQLKEIHQEYENEEEGSIEVL